MSTDRLNLLQHQVLLSDLDFGSKIGSKKYSARLWHRHQTRFTPSLLYWWSGLVSLHTVCSLILPSDHIGGHTSAATQLCTTLSPNTRAPRRSANAARCSSYWPGADDLVYLRSGHLVRKRPNRGHNKCSSGCLSQTTHCHIWCVQQLSFSLPCKTCWWKADRQ